MSVEKINSTENANYSNILCQSDISLIVSNGATMLTNTYLAHATKVPGLIFLSGQVPADKTGKIVEGGIKEHTV